VTGKSAKDLDIFPKLMAMDDGAFAQRFDGSAAAANLPLVRDLWYWLFGVSSFRMWGMRNDGLMACRPEFPRLQIDACQHQNGKKTRHAAFYDFEDLLRAIGADQYNLHFEFESGLSRV
jgi:hypothetical protein